MGAGSKSAPSVRRTSTAGARRSRGQARKRATFASLGPKARFPRQRPIDFVKHVALVAIADEDRRPTLIGGGRYVVVEPGKAEVAFALIDEYQAKGIGSALIRHLAAIGREAGLRELAAEVLSGNLPMLKVFERSGLAMNTRREGAVVHVTLRYP